jgi:cap2 methyltransferase
MTEARIEELSALYESTGTWNDPRRSPHVWGQLVGNEFQQRRYYSAKGLPLERRVLASAATAQYYRRGNEERTLVHWGQRKLLLAEIEFLTQHGHLADTVVYAGAAPGTHLAMLALLFPKHKLHLYDPAPFNPHLVNASALPNSKVYLHQEMFTDEVAAGWAPEVNESKRVLFVCDIRSANLDVQTHDEFEERVVIDMEAQKRWCELMRADATRDGQPQVPAALGR